MARTQGSHSDITGPRIRSAALQLFAREGYAAVSMRKIAGEVGLQVGALYNYTPDKQSLLCELMQSHMQTLLASLPEVQGTAASRLEMFVRHHLAFHKDRADEIFIAYNELRNLSEENFEQIEVLRRAYENYLIDILEAGLAEGSMHLTDTKVTAMAIIAMLTGISTWYRPEGRLQLSELQDLYWSLVHGLVGLKSNGAGTVP
jgi:AcrR family transcriptional regulator